jgi:hypothetical protein
LAIDEGRLKFTDGSKMKLDHDPFPMNTINLNVKKVLIRPEQAESTKGKGVVIGEPRPKMIVPKKPEVGVWRGNKSGASNSKAPWKTKVTFDMLLEKYEKQGGERARNKGKRPRSPPRERFGHPPPTVAFTSISSSTRHVMGFLSNAAAGLSLSLLHAMGGNEANVQSYASNGIQPRMGRTEEANS